MKIHVPIRIHMWFMRAENYQSHSHLYLSGWNSAWHILGTKHNKYLLSEFIHEEEQKQHLWRIYFMSEPSLRTFPQNNFVRWIVINLFPRWENRAWRYTERRDLLIHAVSIRASISICFWLHWILPFFKDAKWWWKIMRIMRTRVEDWTNGSLSFQVFVGKNDL